MDGSSTNDSLDRSGGGDPVWILYRRWGAGVWAGVIPLAQRGCWGVGGRRCLAERLEAGVGAMSGTAQRLEKAVGAAVAAVHVDVVLVVKRSPVLQAGADPVGSDNPALSLAPGYFQEHCSYYRHRHHHLQNHRRRLALLQIDLVSTCFGLAHRHGVCEDSLLWT